jgi:hypothetical protein
MKIMLEERSPIPPIMNIPSLERKEDTAEKYNRLDYEMNVKRDIMLNWLSI